MIARNISTASPVATTLGHARHRHLRVAAATAGVAALVFDRVHHRLRGRGRLAPRRLDRRGLWRNRASATHTSHGQCSVSARRIGR